MPIKKKSKTTKKRVILAATSSKTGITHIFGDTSHFEKEIKILQRSKRDQEFKDTVNSLSFFNWLTQQTLSMGPSVSWNDSLYRLVYNGFSPTSIMGSLADGGRFNVGGAQLNSLFPSVNKAGCLYLASSIQCCYAEAAPPYGNPEKCELTPKKSLLLWDLSQVIQGLNRPGLEDLVKSSPMEALWSYQKIPMIPQLLAMHLRALGGDGLVYPSTKDPSANNFAFFFRTDAESEQAFTVKKLV
jgi:hypothetical protein